MSAQLNYVASVLLQHYESHIGTFLLSKDKISYVPNILPPRFSRLWRLLEIQLRDLWGGPRVQVHPRRSCERCPLSLPRGTAQQTTTTKWTPDWQVVLNWDDGTFGFLTDNAFVHGAARLRSSQAHWSIWRPHWSARATAGSPPWYVDPKLLRMKLLQCRI